jgi:ATP-dependent helicase/nuclease subunit B
MVSDKDNIERVYLELNGQLSQYSEAAVELLTKEQAARLRQKAKGRKETEYLSGTKDLYFRDNKFRVTQAEKYFECPYAHFLKYGLKLNEPVNDGVDMREAGIITHEVLDKFILGSKDIKSDKAEDFAVRVIESVLAKKEYAAKLNNPVNQGIKNRLAKSLLTMCTDLYAIMCNSDFKPLLSEHRVEKDLGGGIKLVGKVDRVDALGDKISIIDYKTGSGKSADLISELYYGKRLQLFIYLAALKQQGYQPAALLYMKLNDKLLGESDNADRYRSSGFVLDDISVAEALDNSLICSDKKSSVLPVSVKQDKDGVRKFKDSKVLTEQDFNDLCRLSVEAAEQALKDIRQGYIAKRPYKDKYGNACAYCPFTTVCGGTERFRELGKVIK